MPAAQLGLQTRFASLQFNSSEKGDMSGHGPGLSMAWDVSGKPVGGQNGPVAAFHRLFAKDTTPLSQQKALLAQKRSVLDAVMEDARRVQKGLTKTDNDKLEEYFQSLRDIEVRLGKDEQWLNVPKAGAPVAEPKPGLAGKDEIQVMYDLIVAALQTDTTRVITYRQPVGTLLQSLDLKVAPHDMSHYTAGPRMEASQRRDATQSELLAELIDKLKATKEVDGSSLFDHLALAYGSWYAYSVFLVALLKEFGYSNPMQVPKLEKIVLNMGVGEATGDQKKLDAAVGELALISGQKPIKTVAKKAIAGFKIRKGLPIGCKVTLRKARMFEFLDRLVTIALPRVRDFRGIQGKGFDGRGNFAMGLKEQIVFPEINYDRVDDIRGMDIQFVTTAKTDKEAKALLKAFQLPFVN